MYKFIQASAFLLLNSIISANAYTASKQFCASYANTAVIQHINNLENNCGFKGLRWSPLYQGQYKWCLSVREAIASNETKIRNNRLKKEKRQSTYY